MKFFNKILLFIVCSALPNLTKSQCSPDTTAPTVYCLPNIVVSIGSSGTTILDPAFLDNGSFDNCTLPSNLTRSVTPTSVSCADIGTPVIATLTITDEAGNSADCDTEVYVQDRSLPIFNCPINDTIILGPSGMLMLTTELLVSGEASYCPLTYTITPSSVSCSDIGAPVDVMITGTNSIGLSDTCVFTLVVLDNSTPSLNCPTNDTLILGPSGMQNLQDLFIPDETSYCPVSYTVAPASVSCSDIGAPVDVMITVTNGLGYSDTCVFTLVVLDNSTPSLNCPTNDTLILGPSGMQNLQDLFIPDETSYCPVSYTVSPASVSCSDIGAPVDVMITVTNGLGYSDTCVFTLHVEDRTSPVLYCKPAATVKLGASGIVTLTPAMLTDAYSDNCDLTFDISPSTLSCSDNGLNTVTVTATDPGGNSTSCITEVTVDNPRPNSCLINGPSTITCNSSGNLIAASIVGGNGPFTYDWIIKKGESDGWAITSGLGTDSIMIQAGVKKLDLRLTVTDVCGKKRKCKYKIKCTNNATPVNKTTGQNKSFIDENEYDKCEFSIFPNPATDVINIESEMDLTRPMIIIGANGYNSIMSGSNNTHRRLNISHLEPGIYYLVFQHDKERIVKRFMKL